MNSSNFLLILAVITFLTVNYYTVIITFWKYLKLNLKFLFEVQLKCGSLKRDMWSEELTNESMHNGDYYDDHDIKNVKKSVYSSFKKRNAALAKAYAKFGKNSNAKKALQMSLFENTKRNAALSKAYAKYKNV